MAETAPTIYTVGHSNHALPVFLDLLHQHGIEVLVDVRSQPYSKYAAHFNGSALKATIVTAGLKYLFLGKELGGRPDGADYYDPSGRVDYARVAISPLFRAGIDRLKDGSSHYRVALLCAEENPTGCHRRRLVGRVLVAEGLEVWHIRGDGSLTPEAEIAALEARPQASDQLPLFALEPQPEEWKSLLAVRPPRS